MSKMSAPSTYTASFRSMLPFASAPGFSVKSGSMVYSLASLTGNMRRPLAPLGTSCPPAMSTATFSAPASASFRRRAKAVAVMPSRSASGSSLVARPMSTGTAMSMLSSASTCTRVTEPAALRVILLSFVGSRLAAPSTARPASMKSLKVDGTDQLAFQVAWRTPPLETSPSPAVLMSTCSWKPSGNVNTHESLMLLALIATSSLPHVTVLSFVKNDSTRATYTLNPFSDSVSARHTYCVR
mmetsp:Transcript_7530/g.26877  ORF Transcript_7530/g.26877 Transcript_7530/m.26877 type:complete len:241 (+) Transcript_7530:292-1014(+)